MDVIWIAVSAFVGGVITGVLGWLDSKEAFDVRKFGASLVRALVASIGFAVACQYSNGLSPIDIGLAFLGGAGVDVLGNRVSGAIKAGLRGE